MTQSRSPVLKTRELDQLIAEKVFGHCAHPFDSWYHEGPDGDVSLLCGKCHHAPRTPRYSSEVASAFLVVEQMRERDGRYGLILESVAQAGGRTVWWAQFTSDLDIAGTRVWADTPAQAIALAALSALGFDPPEGVQR